MIQPWWLLAGAAGAIWLMDKVTTHWSWRAVTTAAFSLLIVWPLWPMAQRLVAKPGEGYDAVFAYVATQRQTDDVVMTPQPPACVFILGQPCDYYARERGYEPYTIQRNGVLVDRWSGAELLETAEQLEAVIRRAPRVWFVTDRERLAKRYNAAFLQMIVEQFDVAFEERAVLALLATGWQEPPRYTVQRTPNKAVQIGPMQLVNWERTAPMPGAALQTMLFWQMTAALDEPVHTSLQLVRADGVRISQADGAPTDGLVATDDQPLTPLPDYKVITLPTDLVPGYYRLEVVAYPVTTHEPLADPVAIDWFTIGPPAAAPAQSAAVEWQNGLRLLGHDELPNTLLPTAAFTVRLVWATNAPIAEEYTAFVHLVGPDGAIVAQQDRRPLDGFYPTNGWTVAEPVEDFYGLTLPATLPPGDYRLLVGWYQPATNGRLRLPDGSEAYELTRWVVQP